MSKKDQIVFGAKRAGVTLLYQFERSIFKRPCAGVSNWD
jgi:hypothetical protein